VVAPPGRRPFVYRRKKPWEKHLSLAFEQQAVRPLLEAPLGVSLEFRFPRLSNMPKRKERAHVVKPDLDNCLKNVMDAAEGRLFERDQGVSRVEMRKRYAHPGESPGVAVIVEELGEANAPVAPRTNPPAEHGGREGLFGGDDT
jgi:Holliday junction resolvase RusA-like endonuclease